MEKKEHSDQLEDIIDIQDHSITLLEIESDANSVKILEQYEKDNIKSLYSSLHLSLAHEKYSENEARVFWNKIIEHMNKLDYTLDRKVGITVATLDYQSNIKKNIERTQNNRRR